MVGVARAESRHACAPAEADAIAVDGMLDDWQGIDRQRVGGPDRDASFDARCLIVGGGVLALSFDVRDEHVVRSAVAVGAGDDLLEVTLAAGGGPIVVTIAPGVGSIDPQVRVDGKPAPRWLAVETTLQKQGWSAELTVPLAKLRGWKDGTAEVSLGARYRDGDVMKAKTPERTVGDAIVLEVAAGGAGASEPAPSSKDVMAAFLKSTGLSKADVTLDASADVDPTARGPEHVVAGKRVIGLVGARFAYVELPVDADADVIARPRLVDLRGDGSRVILAVVRQKSEVGAGTRDVLLGFGARGGQLGQLFAIEVRRERGGARLESDWSIAKAGKQPQIVVRARPAVGWTVDSYDEGPTGDAEPIALPWDDDRWGAAYTLSGDALAGHALPGKRPTK
jgi:hypothetical protein